MADRRGVSDVVGFILVFSLIVTTVGVAYTTGVGGLQGARNAERVANAGRAFDVLQSHANDVLHRGAPARATEIRLSNAQIGPGDPVTINVSAVTGATTVTPIVYRVDGTRYVYVDGAVIRATDAGAVMHSPPDFRFGSRALVPVVNTAFASARSIGGQARVSVSLAVPSPYHRTLRAANVDGSFNVTITTRQPAPWRRYFTSHSHVTCPRSTAKADGRTALTCTVPAQHVAVPETDLTVSLR